MLIPKAQVAVLEGASLVVGAFWVGERHRSLQNGRETPQTTWVTSCQGRRGTCMEFRVLLYVHDGRIIIVGCTLFLWIPHGSLYLVQGHGPLLW